EELQGIPPNAIVRALGPEPLVQVDVEGPHEVRKGDHFVLCSDGLSGPLTDREIGAVVSTLPPVEACRFLVDLANLQGGPDNITVIVARVLGDGAGIDGDDEPQQAVPKRPWRPPIAWPQGLLVWGVLLSLCAIALTYA